MVRTRWLELLLLPLGLAALGLLGCNEDGSDDETVGDGDSESAESTTSDGDTTTTSDGDTTTSDTGCMPGELGCECSNGLCLGELVCMDGVCFEDDGTTAETTETGTETGPACDPPEMLCDGACVDVMNDNANCGSCGTECTVNLGLGECVEGQCTPTWSGCVPSDPLTACSEVCQSQGFASCGACGPVDLSVMWYFFLETCEDDTFSTVEETSECQNEPNVASDDFYRCCCSQ